MNTSNHRVQTKILPNQLVYIRNNTWNKFDPLFGPEVYKVIDVQANGAILLSLDDSKIKRRHLDDIKDATATVTSDLETCWMDSNPPTQFQPQIPTALEPVMPDVPPQVQPRDQPVVSGPTVPVNTWGTRPQRNRQPPQDYSDERGEMEKRWSVMLRLNTNEHFDFIL